MRPGRARLALAAGLAAVAAAAGGYAWLHWSGGAGAARFRTAKLERGPIAATIETSGTLNAVSTVRVASQISGQIKEIYADFNSPVKENQVIARIDPATFELRVSQARSDLDDARRAAEVARDGLRGRGAAARLRAAQAAVQRRETLLRQAEADLERTVIRAPVDGTVVLRNVDAGQTVTASPQAPVLFLIARDLHEMQVEATVAEADIGRLRVGQPAAFTVDAIPRRSFPGELVQIRKSPANAREAASDTVVISARNPDLALLPGMTATLRIVVDRRDDALRVPNAALRFRPPDATEPAPSGGTGTGRVWVPRSGTAQPVELRLGLSDGTATEVVAGPLSAGDEVIVGLASASVPRDPALPRVRP